MKPKIIVSVLDSCKPAAKEGVHFATHPSVFGLRAALEPDRAWEGGTAWR